ncbi:MAG TPA: AAA family ATPase [Solirubrobacteraceae bacterium]
MAATRDAGFLDRVRERAALDRLLADVRKGNSAVLVIRGEAGIGKTELLRYTGHEASGLRLAQIAGVEAEMELPFAGVHQLCAPMFDRLPALPDPQRNALSVALGMSSGDAPDRFLVGLAVLSLLSAVAEECPLVCCVDDAHWLDAASGQVFGFVARRLLAESVAIVLVVREPHTGRQFDGLPELRLGGLAEKDARALLARVIPGRLADRVRDRIVADTGGNPLALMELPRSMTAAELAGGFQLPSLVDVPGHIEDHYLRRVEALPEATQRLLLVAAADPAGDPTHVWRAAQRLGIGTDALVPAQEKALLEIGERVRFRHPLVRSAAYRAASLHDRQQVHEALAAESDPEMDGDRRAWHRALAASGLDEDVAAELERSAARAQARGGVAATAAFLTRAAALTQDPATRSERALAAAQASVQAGAFDEALGLVATAEAGPLDEIQRAQIALLRGQVAFASGLGSDAPTLLLKAARRLEPCDLKLARETYLTAWGAAGMAGGLAGAKVLSEICHAIQSLPPPQGAPTPLDVLLKGLALLITDGYAAAAAVLQLAAKALTAIPVDDVLRWGWLAMSAPSAVWDFEGLYAITARQLQLVREAGALGQLPLFLSSFGIGCQWMGDFAEAAAVNAEIESVAAATGSPIAPYTLLRLRALQGAEADVAAAIPSAEEAAAGGQEMAAVWAHWAAAVLYNGLARYDEAASAARRATMDSVHPWPAVWALPELVEAAVRARDAELARGALTRLAQTTQPCGTDWALGIEARCRALLTDGAAADELHRDAIDHLGRTRVRPELARAHLLYGEWLRREHRRADARAQLRAAHDQLTSIGMEAFAERARKELVATGGTVRTRRVETRDDLTAQERQIAQLARDGLSNPDIGARLFLSRRTVEWHLHNVFTKLGIRSRSELAGALPGSDAVAVPA